MTNLEARMPELIELFDRINRNKKEMCIGINHTAAVPHINKNDSKISICKDNNCYNCILRSRADDRYYGKSCIERFYNWLTDDTSLDQIKI